MVVGRLVMLNPRGQIGHPKDAKSRSLNPCAKANLELVSKSHNVWSKSKNNGARVMRDVRF